MIPTIMIYDIISRWRDAIANSAEISAYCQEHYSKASSVFVGLDLKRAPDIHDCPLVIIRPGSKVEGESESQFSYSVGVSWAIMNEGRTTTGNITEMSGVKEVDELGQLILKTLREINPDCPISTINYDIDSIEFFPQHVGEMQLTTTVTRTLGSPMQY